MGEKFEARLPYFDALIAKLLGKPYDKKLLNEEEEEEQL